MTTPRCNSHLTLLQIWINTQLWLLTTSAADLAFDQATIIQTKATPEIARIGSSVTLECIVAKAYPSPVLWIQSSQNAILSINTDLQAIANKTTERGKAKYSISKTQTNDGLTNISLTLHDVTIADGGLYKCQIRLLPTEQRIERQVKFVSVIPPTIQVDSMSNRVRTALGENVTLECIANGYPPPSVGWFKRRQIQVLSKQVNKHFHWTKVGESAVFALENVTLQDEGVYRCLAQNGYGLNATYEISLHVLYAPEVNIEAPRYKNGMVTLTCLVNGNPKPKIRWMKRNKEKSTGSQITSGKGTNCHIGELSSRENITTKSTLEIRQFREADTGLYDCEASNLFNVTKHMIKVTSKGLSCYSCSLTMNDYGEWRASIAAKLSSWKSLGFFIGFTSVLVAQYCHS